jgi:hypothetical protein
MIASSTARMHQRGFVEFDLGIQCADWLRSIMTGSIRFLDLSYFMGGRAAIDGNAVFALEAATAEGRAAPRGRHKRESR